MKYGNLKMASLVSRYLSDIIQLQLKKEIGIFSISRVVVSKDNAVAKIFFTCLGVSPEKVVESLTLAKGFLRSELAKKLTTYKTPELNFIYDDSFEETKRIQKLIEEVNKKQ
ncbi:MAG: 30S ribosome-binding factor RbfA [Bacillales bacterium]|jgi:ribosome-binding factor A|nr:30S ribosome-binding factor RbfA [Bacillales bacterium]